MDSVRNCDSHINISSSQTFRSHLGYYRYSTNYILHKVLIWYRMCQLSISLNVLVSFATTQLIPYSSSILAYKLPIFTDTSHYKQNSTWHEIQAESLSRRKSRTKTKTVSPFMEHEGSLPRSQEPVTGPYPYMNESSPHFHTLFA
jgi:hypothetical protein